MEQKYPHNTENAASRQLKIEECLLNRMKVLPYERISVADLCRQMGISRQLFYTYFPDKDSCLDSLLFRMIRDSVDEMLLIPQGSSMHDTIVAYLNFWQNHSDFLDVIVRQQMKTLVVERSFLYFKNNKSIFMDYLNTPEVKADDSILWLYCAFRFTILMQWHESGYALPVEKMAVKYLRMLNQPILRDNM